MKPCVSLWSMEKAVRENRLDQTGFIHWASQQQLTQVELLSYFMEGDKPKTIRQLLDMKDISVPCYTIVTNLVSPTEADWAIFKKDIVEASILGASFVRITGGDGFIPANQAIPQIIANIKQALTLCKNTPITLVLENMGPYTGHSEDVAFIMAAVDSPRLKVNFDTANMLLSDEDPLVAFENLNEWISLVHFKDFQPVDSTIYKSLAEGDHWKVQKSLSGQTYLGCSLGEGIVPLKELYARLQVMAFDCVISVEYEGTGDLDHTSRSLRYLRSLSDKCPLGM